MTNINQYISLPDADIVKPENWYRLFSWTPEQVENCQIKWTEIIEQNKQIYQKRLAKCREELRDIESFLSQHKINFYKNVSSKNKDYLAWFKKNISDVLLSRYHVYRYPMSMPVAQPGSYDVNGIKVTICCSPTSLSELYRQIHRQVESGTRLYATQELLAIKSVEQAIKLGISTAGKEMKQIVEEVNETAKEKFRQEYYPDGTMVRIDDNYCDCECYTIGDNRCHCGNRRIDWRIEGNVLNGFYLHTEPY